jgi:hypothetical protein
MNQGSIHFFEHSMVALNHIHGRGCDETGALERSANFFVLFKHQDLEAVSA